MGLSAFRGKAQSVRTNRGQVKSDIARWSHSAPPLSGTADRTFTTTNQPALRRCCLSRSTRRFVSRRRLPSLTCTILLGTHAGRRGNPPPSLPPKLWMGLLICQLRQRQRIAAPPLRARQGHLSAIVGIPRQ